MVKWQAKELLIAVFGKWPFFRPLPYFYRTSTTHQIDYAVRIQERLPMIQTWNMY